MRKTTIWAVLTLVGLLALQHAPLIAQSAVRIFGTNTAGQSVPIQVDAGGSVKLTLAVSGYEFEGTTDDAFETTIAVTDPTADRTFTLPDADVTAADLLKIVGITNGTVAVGKAIVPTTDKHIDALVISDGGFALGAGAGTVVSSTAAELNLIDGSVAGTSVASKALVLGADKNTDSLALPVSGLKIGAGAGTAVDRTAAQVNALAQGVAAGYIVARGTVTLDGVNPSSAATGLTAIVSCTVTQKRSTAPALDPTHFTIVTDAVAGQLDIYAWKPTASGDATLIASEDADDTIDWLCVGT